MSRHARFLFYTRAGIQLQTHRKIGAVLFAEGGGWKTVAATYQRQSKGKCVLDVIS